MARPVHIDDVMGLVIALVVGLVAGALARLIMPGRDPGGVVITMVLGVAGAVVAYFIGSGLGWYDTAGEGPGVIASAFGALLVLGLYRAFSGRRAWAP